MTKEHLKLLIQIILIKLQILLLRKKLTAPTLKKPKHIVIHHSGGNWNFSQVDNHHRRKWGFVSFLGFGCGYQYFIEYSGEIYQARRDNERSAHTVEVGRPGYWNNNSIGICLQGNFMTRTITLKQANSLRALLRKLEIKYKIPRTEIYGHREISDTNCPGDTLFKLIKEYRK